MHRTSASLAVGLNRPVSMEEMVWHETCEVGLGQPRFGARRFQAIAQLQFAVVVMHLIYSEGRQLYHSNLRLHRQHDVLCCERDDAERCQQTAHEAEFHAHLVELEEAHGRNA